MEKKTTDENLEPLEAKPCIHEGVIYSLDFIRTDSGQLAGGYISATDEKTGLAVWDKFVYTTQFDSSFGDLEQEVRITHLFMEGGRLVAIDSLGNRYELDPKTGEKIKEDKKK